ncbi:hypothetical protein [Streptomyces sp. NPDC005408]|uniref:hypothetical protein n=1 Tax=Streptomyces sp. NPDC005408 TaxID=3155341 RepID=UPI0033B334BF
MSRRHVQAVIALARRRASVLWALLRDGRVSPPLHRSRKRLSCDVLAAQRRERAHIRSEKGLRWGGRPLIDAA